MKKERDKIRINKPGQEKTVENSVYTKRNNMDDPERLLQQIIFWLFTVSSWRALLLVVIKSDNKLKFVFSS